MKIDFSERHPGPELMDRDDIPAQDLFQNYRELHLVNKWLGGYKITLHGLAQLIDRNTSFSVLDIGCGGGDMLKTVAGWSRRKKIQMQLTGIDISAAAIEYSRSNCKSFPEIEIIDDDVFHHLASGKKYDVVINCLFTHHFSSDQIVRLLRMMNEASRKGFLINDLERNKLAFSSIKLLTDLFSKSYLVKNDAPLSVRRGFKKSEWVGLIKAAGITDAEIKWKWAFRHLVVARK